MSFFKEKNLNENEFMSKSKAESAKLLNFFKKNNFSSLEQIQSYIQNKYPELNFNKKKCVAR